MGIALNLEEYELKVIEINHKDDIKRRISEMLQLWLDNGNDVTYKTLAEALLAADEVEAALKLYHTRGKVNCKIFLLENAS